MDNVKVRYINRHEVTSTNSYAKELLNVGADLPDFTVITAEFQNSGRGQQGNSWESECGQNLLFSLVCHPQTVKATNQFVLSQAIALAVQQVLSEYVDGITVKWPNDIYYHDSKLCGILIECNLVGGMVSDCIIGVGINVNQRMFLSDAPNPISLAQITGFTLKRELILQKVVERFVALYADIECGVSGQIAEEYMQSLYRREGFYHYIEPDGDDFDAEIINVLPTGHLVLRLLSGEVRRYELKEIRFVI